MTRTLVLTTLAALLVTLEAGCPFSTPQTTVNLVNQTSYPVDVQLFYHHNQNILQALLEVEGTEVTVRVKAGETYRFARRCEDLQAIFIKDADMRVALGISPEASTRVYREPGDFGCGHTLTFRFTQNTLGTRLEISYAEQR